MKNIIAFAGSNSLTSINKQLVTYTAAFLKEVEVTILDLNDFSIPIYSIDIENNDGIPQQAERFLNTIQNADGLLISLAEHNGNFTAVFKNLYDWMSRIDKNIWKNIPMLLMSTSPGGGGASSVMSIAKQGFPHMGGDVVADFSLPNFYDNFKSNELINTELKETLLNTVVVFENALKPKING